MSQTTIVRLLLNLITLRSWFSFLLILIILGGIIVLFIYISRLASNENFTLTVPLSRIKILTLSLILLIVTIYISYHHLILKDKRLNFKKLILKIFSSPLRNIIILVIIYLFISLIITVYIVKLKDSPIRRILEIY